MQKSFNLTDLVRIVAKNTHRFFHATIRAPNHEPEKTHHWFQVLCLTGVDYFSTLAYQPGIALLAVGALSPVATLVLIIVTLFGAVPTYIQVAKRSFTGQGSIAILETLIAGWKGKLVALTLIAFAVTDFCITVTLSASDAAAHLVENAYLRPFLTGHNLSLSVGLVTLLGLVFYIGIREAVIVSMFSTIPYILLTTGVIGDAFWQISKQPELVSAWLHDPVFHADYASIVFLALLSFPKLALGLSGFETGVSVMPIIHNNDTGRREQNPLAGRIQGTAKLLTTSAVVMSVLLLLSSVATSILLKQSQVQEGGEASGRALAFLAHKYMGAVYGSVYDISTIIILWFAGASAMAGLLSLIPRYLPRFGMCPPWLESQRPMIILTTCINILIVWVFRADVNAQSGAYATGVLALILSAAVAVTLSIAKEQRALQKPRDPKMIYFGAISVVLGYTLIANILERPDGLFIASIFFVAIIVSSAISRWSRAFELRVDGFGFIDKGSEMMFRSIQHKKVELLPTSSLDENWIHRKQEKIETHYHIHGKLAFLAIHLRDDRSQFVAPLELRVTRMPRHKDAYLIEVFGAVAIPNTIAYISQQLDPISIYLGLARKNAMEQSFAYLFFGEGEIGLLTYKVLVQHWESLPTNTARPMIFLMSE